MQCEDKKKGADADYFYLFFLLFVKWLHLQKKLKLKASSRLPSVDSSSTDTEDQLYIYF